MCAEGSSPSSGLPEDAPLSVASVMSLRGVSKESSADRMHVMPVEVGVRDRILQHLPCPQHHQSGGGWGVIHAKRRSAPQSRRRR
eukprot:COSAG04_NODE_2760_length_3626_cov_8.144430_3_plen_85_part_00